MDYLKKQLLKAFKNQKSIQAKLLFICRQLRAPCTGKSSGWFFWESTTYYFNLKNYQMFRKEKSLFVESFQNDLM